VAEGVDGVGIFGGEGGRWDTKKGAAWSTHWVNFVVVVVVVVVVTMSQTPLTDKLRAVLQKKRREPVVADGEDGGDVKPRSPKRRKTTPEPVTVSAEPQVVEETADMPASPPPVTVLSIIPTEEEILAAISRSMEERDAWKKVCEAQIVAKVDKWAQAFRQKTFTAIAALSGQTRSAEHLEVILDHVRLEFVPGKPHRDQYIVNEAMDRFREQFKENLGAWVLTIDIKDMLAYVKLMSQGDGERHGVIRAEIKARMHVA